ncbi:MAG: MFS transporter, partial [Ktedonobacterales bacterium]
MAQRTEADGGRRAWTLVVTLGLTETTSYGVLYYSFTVFLTPMQAELGWSRSALTGAFSLALLLSGVVGLLVGRWLDRHGPHGLMTIGSCVAVALVLAWSQARNLVVFYLIWAAMGVALAAVLYEPAFWVVARHFTRQRGRALTVLTFIAGFASVIFVPLAGALALAQGWRAALVTLAIILAVGTIPAHALVLRERRALT